MNCQCYEPRQRASRERGLSDLFSPFPHIRVNDSTELRNHCQGPGLVARRQWPCSRVFLFPALPLRNHSPRIPESQIQRGPEIAQNARFSSLDRWSASTDAQFPRECSQLFCPDVCQLRWVVNFLLVCAETHIPSTNQHGGYIP